MRENDSNDVEYAILGSGTTIGSADDARKEGFFYMCKNMCCPYWTFLSFTFIVTCIQVVLFFITVGYDYDTDAFLTPKHSTLVKFGSTDFEKMRYDYELWRFFTAGFLNGNLLQLFIAAVFQFIIGFRVEPSVGTLKTAAVYIVSIIGSSFFSTMCAPSWETVGESGLPGLLMSIVPWIMLNWNSLAEHPMRTCTIIWVVCFIIFGFLFGFGTFRGIDFFSTFGSLLTGFTMGLAIYTTMKPEMEPSAKIMKFSGLGVLLFYFGLSIILFFTAVEE